MSTTVATFLALFLAIVNRVFKLGLISRLTEQVTFVLIPPLILIFLVLGTIFLGIATPTEGGAMGAVGALIMSAARGRLSMEVLKGAWKAPPSCRSLCCSFWSVPPSSASLSMRPMDTSGSSTCSMACLVGKWAS